MANFPKPYGVMMGMNRMDPLGFLNRSVAHGVAPTQHAFKRPPIAGAAHMAMGGLPPVQQPGLSALGMPMQAAPMQRPAGMPPPGQMPPPGAPRPMLQSGLMPGGPPARPPMPPQNAGMPMQSPGMAPPRQFARGGLAHLSPDQYLMLKSSFPRGMPPGQRMADGGSPDSGDITPSSGGGISNALLMALLGAGAGAFGGGKNGAIAGALMGPSTLPRLFSKDSGAAGSTDDGGPDSGDMSSLLGKYLPALLQYSGAMYKNPTSTPLTGALAPGAPQPQRPSYYTYGVAPQASGRFAPYTALTTQSPAAQSQGQPVQASARGGLSMASRYIKGPGTGTSDDIPAKLSNGEYVMDAQTVAALGDGSNDAGAEKLDKFRQNVRKHKGKALARGQMAPDSKDPQEYLP